MQFRENNWTIPNILTVTRILLTPGFVMSFIGGQVDMALALFTLAGVTDAADGLLARVLHQRTRLGAMLDPLADKVLISSAFLCLGISGWVPAWLVVMVISRDLIIVGGLALLTFWGVDIRREIHPSWLSKFNTTGQIGLTFLILVRQVGLFSLPYVVEFLVYAVAIMTALTGIDYVMRGLALFPSNGDGESGAA
ncbi:cardiolipin synthase [Desulfobaculum xiamenense]|uniref:CDP-diacylglycerol--glycerol-3-phosphate 3-phosphatidyltransferase n=1 Tax=Desulfobaculum xiamenense TaxID=995050 RepID=A0A846QHP6_9BACT|nr:CDP-alcohol phosphatidyltransferase family protein [Desulfobaculum xiamenense]NJB66640.1 cardiolipin synthase [Desulfobaculum xiamenense]